MTAYEIWDQINHFVMNTKTDEAVGNAIRKLQCENKENDAIKYIKDFFECDADTAKDAYEIFKNEMGAPPSQQQIAHANTVARELQNKPKCPTCSSTNIKKVSGTSKAISVAMFGLLSQKVKKTFHCNNCGYEW